MGPWTHERLLALAHPWPVEWLFPPRPGDPQRVVNLFAGPGGWEQGLKLLDPGGFDVVGVEIGFDAAATAVAAGHRRIVADVRTLSPINPALRYVEGMSVSAPCQVWTPAGKRDGHQANNLDLLLDTFTLACEASFGHWHDSGESCDPDTCGMCSDPTWDGFGGFTGPLITFDEARALVPQMTDERIGLIAETLIWSLALTARFDNLRWLAMEQSSALPETVLDAVCEELQIADWCSTGYQVLDAADVGVASHRRRVYLVAGRHHFVDLEAMHPARPVPARTAAEVLGWPAGVRVNTRGNRRTSGGNEWSADRTAPGITSKIRGWYWAHDKDRRFTVPEAALLVAMPGDYPWTGSRSSACQQLADIVIATEAARVIGGGILRQPWEQPVADYLTTLYTPHRPHQTTGRVEPVRSRRAAAATASGVQAPMLPGLDAWIPAPPRTSPAPSPSRPRRSVP